SLITSPRWRSSPEARSSSNTEKRRTVRPLMENSSATHPLSMEWVSKLPEAVPRSSASGVGRGRESGEVQTSHDTGGIYGTANQRDRPRFHGRDHPGPDPLPRLAGRLLGGAVLASEGLHPGLHHRAGLHGAHQAGVRQA